MNILNMSQQFYHHEVMWRVQGADLVRIYLFGALIRSEFVVMDDYGTMAVVDRQRWNK